jgi:16S rRNA (guanine527-N7)-methyltransferase
MPNGVLYLKGGDLQQEIAESGIKNVTLTPLSKYFEEDFFDTKFVLSFGA